MMKRIASFVLLLALCLSLMPATASAASEGWKVMVKDLNIKADTVYNYDGMAVVCKDGKYTLLDREGKIFREAKAWIDYDGVSDLYMVQESGYYHAASGSLAFSKEQMEANVKAYLQEHAPMGDIESLQTKVMSGFSDGYAVNCFTVVYNDGGDLTLIDFYAVIDPNGLVVYTTPLLDLTSGGGFPKLWVLGRCSEGVMRFGTWYFDHDKEEHPYDAGFINTDGSMALRFLIEAPDNESSSYVKEGGDYLLWDDLHESTIVAAVKGSRKYGVLDYKGDVLVPFKYDRIRPFHDGYAAAYDKDRGWGFIGKDGSEIIPFAYDETVGHEGGLFVIALDGKYGVTDSQNLPVVPAIRFEFMTEPAGGVVYAVENGEVYALTFRYAQQDDAGAVWNVFPDVPKTEWYIPALQKAYDSGIVKGKVVDGQTVYNPGGELTHAEIMVMTAKLHSMMKKDGYDFDAHLAPGGAWYQPFRDYCVAEGIVDGRFDAVINDPVNRAGMAYYFANTLTPEYYAPVREMGFTDVSGDPYRASIEKLANANIVSGYEQDDGTFEYHPDGTLKRSEAASFVYKALNLIEGNGAR